VKNFDKQYLRQARLRAGLSLEDTARGICSVSLLSLIERGQRSASPEILEAIHLRLAISDEDAPNKSESTELLQACIELENNSSRAAKEWLPRIKNENEAILLQGLIAGTDGNYEMAIPALESIARNKSLSVQSLQRAVLELIRLERNQGDFYSAIYWGQQHLEVLAKQNFDTTSLEFETKATLSSVYLAVGDLTKASELVKSRPDSVDTTWDAVVSLWSASQVAYERGDFVQAREQILGASQLIAGLDRKMSQARLVQASIFISCLTNRVPSDSDIKDLLQIIELFSLEKSDADLANTLNTLAMAYLLRGEIESAISKSNESLSYCHHLPKLEKAEQLVDNAQVLLACKVETQPLNLLLEAASLLKDNNKSRATAKIWAQMAEVYEGLDQSDQALECYRNSVDAAGVSLKREAARQLT
jgi:tetratricopeptide (TPR) repeat protein